MSGMSLQDRLHAGELVDVSAEGRDREVPAELISELLVRSPDDDAWNLPLLLTGARITGTLDLESATLTRPVVFSRCSFDEMVVLAECQALSMRFADCDLPSLVAEDLVTRGDLELTDSRIAAGVSVRGAHIGGMLSLNGSTIQPDDGIAVQASRVTVGADLSCAMGFAAYGELRLYSARISGGLTLDEATIRHSEGPAIGADTLHVGGHAAFEKARIEGETRLVGARIGDLDISAASFSNPGNQAVTASGLVVDGSLLGREKLRINGELELTGARIGGSLDLEGAIIENEGGAAISADRINIGTNAHLRYGFRARGLIQLGGARIGGQLDLAGATLSGDPAITAYSAVVEGNVLCDNGFRAEGSLSFMAARIGGELEISDCELRNQKGFALSLRQVRVAGPATVAGRVFEGGIDLGDARVGSWCDDESVWPDGVYVNGFQYGAIEGMSVEKRLDWLRRAVGGYAPQPYHQLATVLRNHGQDGDARRVAIAGEWRRRSARSGPLGWLQIAWSVFLRGSVGYGYRPWLVLAPWTVLLIVGSFIFDHAHRHGTLLPAHAAGRQPEFQSVRYTLDLLLPVANLELRGAFVATSTTAWLTTGFMLAGWLLALTLVAALTGVFKH